MKILGRFRSRALTPPTCTNERRNWMVSEGASNGVMDESSQMVQKAGAHPRGVIVVDVAVIESHVTTTDAEASALPDKDGHGNVIQRGDGRRLRAPGTFRMQALTLA